MSKASIVNSEIILLYEKQKNLILEYRNNVLWIRNHRFQLKEYCMIIILDFRLEFSARNFRQFYNGEKIPLPCFGSPELLDECGGEFA